MSLLLVCTVCIYNIIYSQEIGKHLYISVNFKMVQTVQTNTINTFTAVQTELHKVQTNIVNTFTAVQTRSIDSINTILYYTGD